MLRLLGGGEQLRLLLLERHLHPRQRVLCLRLRALRQVELREERRLTLLSARED